MGIPMWREPSKAEVSKSALEKDLSAITRSPIRRGTPSRHTSSRTRRSSFMSSLHPHIIEVLRRGPGEPRRVPRFSFISPNGASDSGVDGISLEQAEREALGRTNSRSSAPRQTDTASRRNRNSRDPALTDLLSRMDGQPRFGHASPSLTNFAPALQYATNAPSIPSDSSLRLPPMRHGELHPQPPANAFFPPEIRDRSRNTQSRPTRDPVVDGLGDRQRSPSPDGEHETDAWETLLATITPDATLPSNDSSFASTSSAPDVSRSVVPRHTINLPQGLPVAIGVARAQLGLDPYPDNLYPCDLDSSDDEHPPISLSEFMQREPARTTSSSSRRFHHQHSTFSNHPPLPSFAGSLPDHHQNDDLQHMQVILDRLARRQDIPDDWWAAAGLARTLDRGLSANTDSTDTEGPSRTNPRDD